MKIVDLKNKVKTLEAQDAPMPVRMDAITEVNKEWKNIKEKDINRVLGDAAFEAGNEIHHAMRNRKSYFFSIPPLDK